MKSKIQIVLFSVLVLLLSLNCQPVTELGVQEMGGELPTFEPGAEGSDVSMNVFALLLQNVNSNPQSICTAEACAVMMNPCVNTASEDCIAADVNSENVDDAEEDGDEEENDAEVCADDAEDC